MRVALVCGIAALQLRAAPPGVLPIRTLSAADAADCSRLCSDQKPCELAVYSAATGECALNAIKGEDVEVLTLTGARISPVQLMAAREQRDKQETQKSSEEKQAEASEAKSESKKSEDTESKSEDTESEGKESEDKGSEDKGSEDKESEDKESEDTESSSKESEEASLEEKPSQDDRSLVDASSEASTEDTDAEKEEAESSEKAEEVVEAEEMREEKGADKAEEALEADASRAADEEKRAREVGAAEEEARSAEERKEEAEMAAEAARFEEVANEAAVKQEGSALKFAPDQSLEVLRHDAAEAREMAAEAEEDTSPAPRRLPSFRPGLFRHACACMSLVQAMQEPCDCEEDSRRYHRQFGLTSWYDVQAAMAGAQTSAP